MVPDYLITGMPDVLKQPKLLIIYRQFEDDSSRKQVLLLPRLALFSA